MTAHVLLSHAGPVNPELQKQLFSFVHTYIHAYMNRKRKHNTCRRQYCAQYSRDYKDGYLHVYYRSSKTDYVKYVIIV